MIIAVNARLLQKDRMEGIARYIYEVTRRMVLNHPEHDFIFLFDRPFDQQFIFANNVTGVRVGLPARSPILFNLWFDYTIPRALKKNKADLFFSGDAYLSLRTNIPSVMVSHDLAYLHYPEHLPASHLRHYRKYFPKYHQKADAIIAVSEATKSDIVNQYDIDPAKIHIGHNATPKGFTPVNEYTKEKTKAQYSQDKPYFFYIGSLHPRKNIHGLINAFSAYKKKYKTEHQLVIVGRKAWNYNQIQTAYDQSECKDEIHMYHNIKDEAKAMLASAEAMIYISTFEGFGIPILEAFSSGVPVITSNTSSMPEVAGDAAILVDPTSTTEIVAAMQSVVNDPTLRASLIAKGHERTKAFDWNQTAEVVWDVIEGVVK